MDGAGYKKIIIACDSYKDCLSSREVERIYLDAWAKGISVPYFEGKKVFLANPDGSDDEVTFDVKTRKYTVIQQVAAPGRGKMSYLLHA